MLIRTSIIESNNNNSLTIESDELQTSGIKLEGDRKYIRRVKNNKNDNKNKIEDNNCYSNNTEVSGSLCPQRLKTSVFLIPSSKSLRSDQHNFAETRKLCRNARAAN